MANLLSRFLKSSVATKDQHIDYKPVINASGDFTKTVGLETILNSWNTILQIQRRTYFFDPEFGCDITKRVFDPVDKITLEMIKDEIEEQLFGNDDRATLENIDVKILRNKKGFSVSIYVSYKGQRSVISTVIDPSTYLNILG